MAIPGAGIQENVKPAVSIVLPYYEGRKWLGQSVGSVRSQTASGWELIVVDDGSSDPAAAVIREFGDKRLKHIRIAHGGKGRALNRGVAEAQADWICFIDQDDLMLPGRLESQLHAIEKAPQADAVYSDYERRRSDGTLLDRFISHPVSPEEAIHQMAVGRSPFSMQTLMVKRSACGKAGGFSDDPELTGLDDADFFLRLLLVGARLIYAPGAVQCWIKHDRNYSGSFEFQSARVHWLKRVSQLAEEHPVLRRQLKHFGLHAYGMRGLYFLENGQAALAVKEFRSALNYAPFSINTIYLWLKALVVSATRLRGSPRWNR
jgi:glycosyltransferase involved in cell wall biosynthesis